MVTRKTFAQTEFFWHLTNPAVEPAANSRPRRLTFPPGNMPSRHGQSSAGIFSVVAHTFCNTPLPRLQVRSSVVLMMEMSL
jgi:hypothetical protein